MRDNEYGHDQHTPPRDQNQAVLFSPLLDAVPIPAYFKTPEGIFISCNTAFSRILGLPKDKIIGMPASSLMPQKTVLLHTEKEQELLQRGGAADYECPFVFADSTTHIVMVHEELVAEDASERGIAGVLIDITERRSMERALEDLRAETEIRVRVRTAELDRERADLRTELDAHRKTEEELRRMHEDAARRTESFFNRILSGIPDCIVVLDMDMNIVRANKAVEDVSPALPVEGRKCYEVLHCRAEPCEVCPVRETLRTGKTAGAVVIQTPAHSTVHRWVELAGYPLSDSATGKLTGVIAYLRDITLQRRLYANLMRKKTGLQDALARQESVIVNLQSENQRLTHGSSLDCATGIYNRKFLERTLDQEWNRAYRLSMPLSVIMLRMESLRVISDVYGREFAATVMRQAAVRLKSLTRAYDYLARFDASTFVIVSPAVDSLHAAGIAQRAHEAVSGAAFGDTRNSVKVKAACAVCAYPECKAAGGHTLLEQVENKLAVSQGRNVARASRSGSGILKECRPENLLSRRIKKTASRMRLAMIKSLVSCARPYKMREGTSRGTIERMSSCAADIGRSLGLAPEEIRLVEEAAQVYDIGKIRMPAAALFKKKRLSRREFQSIKRHPQAAAEILGSHAELRNLIPFVMYHHECWDGSGYPFGMRGESIPTGARIIAVIDSFGALISPRPYRPAFVRRKAAAIIKEGAGTRFDPRVVCAFLELINCGKSYTVRFSDYHRPRQVRQCPP